MLDSVSLQTGLMAQIDGTAGQSFEDMVTALFHYQYEGLEAYRRLCDSRGITPEHLAEWRDIPGVPDMAFKQLPLGMGQTVRTFCTSGTSGSSPGKVAYSEADMQLMDRSIEINASRMLVPDVAAGSPRPLFAVLAPQPAMVPAMIMAYGMQRLIDFFGHADSRFWVTTDGLDVPGLIQTLDWAIQTHTPVVLIGATATFVRLCSQLSLKLPEGSRIMDAGGQKAGDPLPTRDALDTALRAAFGAHIRHANLLGMTELGSQFYEPGIATGIASIRKQNPPWTRTQALDPVSLKPLPMGQRGLLWHLDMANRDHPAFVLTQDMGAVFDDGFEIYGRAAGADAKGCSLSVAQLLGS